LNIEGQTKMQSYLLVSRGLTKIMSSGFGCFCSTRSHEEQLWNFTAVDVPQYHMKTSMKLCMCNTSSLQEKHE